MDLDDHFTMNGLKQDSPTFYFHCWIYRATSYAMKMLRAQLLQIKIRLWSGCMNMDKLQELKATDKGGPTHVRILVKS